MKLFISRQRIRSKKVAKGNYDEHFILEAIETRVGEAKERSGTLAFCVGETLRVADPSFRTQRFISSSRSSRKLDEGSLV